MCRPESIPNSVPSPPASNGVMDDVEKSENLGPADLMVVLDIINEGENINSDKFSPEPILTDLHKLTVPYKEQVLEQIQFWKVVKTLT